MKRITLVLFALFTVVSFSCSQKEFKADILTREAFLDSISQRGAQVADIRTPEEHANDGNFPNAKNIDFTSDDFYETMKDSFDTSKPLYIHCRRGVKSHKSIKGLQKMGFTEIYELDGGFDNWQGEEE